MEKARKVIEGFISFIGLVFGLPGWVFKLLPKKWQGYKTFLLYGLTAALTFLNTYDIVPIIQATVDLINGLTGWALDGKAIIGLYTLLFTGIATRIRLETKTPAFMTEEKYVEQLVVENYDLLVEKLSKAQELKHTYNK